MLNKIKFKSYFILVLVKIIPQKTKVAESIPSLWNRCFLMVTKRSPWKAKTRAAKVVQIVNWIATEKLTLLLFFPL